jgi:hypothetical protein
MPDTPPASSPPARLAATIAPRALRWTGYIGVAVFVWSFLSGWFDNLEPPITYLVLGVFLCCALLAALPETQPVQLSAPLAVAGAFVGTAMIWLLD